MELEEVKGIINTYHQAGRSREETIAMVSAIPIDGEASEAFKYVNLKWQTTPETNLPEIVITNRSLKEKTADAMAAIEEVNRPEYIFVRGGALTRIVIDEDGRPITEAMGESAFRGVLERSANFVRHTEKGEVVPVSPPLDIVRDAMSLPKWNLPPLLGITESPVIRADGSILTAPGYDCATRLYYVPSKGLLVPPIPDQPTDGQVTDAANLLDEIVWDFPFDSEASRANAIGTMLTPILRPMIPGPTPLGLFDKPQVGTGASLLSEVISAIATGRPAAMMTASKDDDAWRKCITSLLLKGQSVITIDNCEGTLYSASLAAVLTASIWEDRILGRNEMISLPNKATWLATGNNVRLGGDLPRRAYLIRMDACDARPWLRDTSKFKHPNLIQFVIENRGTILGAILTLIKAWIVAGRPQAPNILNLGGYEAWVKIIGSILDFAGVKGFLGNLGYFYDKSDAETPQWAAFFEAWHDTFEEQPVTTAEIGKEAAANEDLGNALPDNLVSTKKDDSKGFTRRLGKALAAREGRRYPNGLMIIKAGEKKHAITWKVVSFGDKGAKAELATRGEFSEFGPNPMRETLGGKRRMGETKLSKLTSEAKSGEFGAENSPDNEIPDYPTQPCPACGCGDFWLTDDNRWFCRRCHPKPGEGV